MNNKAPIRVATYTVGDKASKRRAKKLIESGGADATLPHPLDVEGVARRAVMKGVALAAEQAESLLREGKIDDGLMVLGKTASVLSQMHALGRGMVGGNGF